MPGTNFFFAPAYDYISEGGQGSKARCNALGKIMANFPFEERTVILTGGRNSKSETTLAHQMEDYMGCRFTGSYRVYPTTEWGTLAEIEHAFRVMQFSRPDLPVTVWVSTNPGHMLRTLIYMHALKPKGWTIRPIFAKHRFCWKDRLVKEPLKVLIALARYPALRSARTTY